MIELAVSLEYRVDNDGLGPAWIATCHAEEWDEPAYCIAPSGGEALQRLMSLVAIRAVQEELQPPPPPPVYIEPATDSGLHTLEPDDLPAVPHEGDTLVLGGQGQRVERLTFHDGRWMVRVS